MKTANECRAKAADLERLAVNALEPTAAFNFLQLAAIWREQADAIDEEAERAERPRYASRR